MPRRTLGSKRNRKGEEKAVIDRKRMMETFFFLSPSRFIQLFSQHGGRRRRPFPTFAGRLNRLNAGSYMAYKTTCNDEVLRVFFFYFNDIWMSKHTYVYFLFFQKNYDKKIGHVEIAQFSIVSFFLFINFFFYNYTNSTNKRRWIRQWNSVTRDIYFFLRVKERRSPPLSLHR